MDRLLKRVLRSRDERGVGMVTALTVMLVVFATGALWVQQSVHQTQSSGLERAREQALAAAEAGLNRMMSQLSTNATNCSNSFSGSPAPPLTGTISGGGEYEVAFPQVGDSSYIDCANVTQLGRYIIARGYAPTKANPVAKRQVEQQVDLIGTDGFRYAVFASNGAITSANQVNIRGDVYSYNPVTIANNSTISGDLISRGAATLTGGTKVTGRVWTGGAVDVNTSGTGTGVDGDVWTSVGGINVVSRIGGNAQAAGSITGSGTVGGTKIPNSPTAPPPDLRLPTFTWASANYSSPCIWSTSLPPACDPSSTATSPAGAFQTYWDARIGGFSGHHRITSCGAPYSAYACSPAVGAITLGTKWTMSGDTTIVSDGPMNVSRDLNTGSAGTLVIVSNYPGTPCTTISTACTAITLSNNWTAPPGVKVLIFAGNGCVDVNNQKTFTGTIYARCVDLDNSFDLTYYPVTPPGFDWSTSASVHHTIQARTFREAPFGS